LDSDGDIDLVISNSGQPNVTILFNSNSGADISVSKHILDFGIVKIDSIKILNFTIYNIGADSTLHINNILSSSSSIYTVPNQTFVLPGDSTDIDVYFTPDRIGLYQDTLQIISNDPDNPVTNIYLSGKGDPIVSQIPKQNEINVLRNSNVSISFYEQVNESTINDSSFVVSRLRTGIIQGNYSYNNNTKTILFNPAINFSAGEVITIVLTSDIEYGNGSPIDAYEYRFTTETDSGSATFTGFYNYTVGENPWTILSADLDLDLDFDVVTVNRGLSGNISIYFNQGNGILQSRTDYVIGYSPWSATSADFNADGAMDLAITEESTGSVSILLNNGSGLFPTKTEYTVGSVARYICSADFDADGDFDLAISKGPINTIAVMLNNGNGLFQQINHFPAIPESYSITSLDVDEDGDIDLATTNSNSSDISIFFNDGSGNFGIRNDYQTNSFGLSLISTDFNSDGLNDLARTNSSNNAVSIFLNDGNGSFLPKMDYTTANIPLSIFTSDYDSDGDMDLAITNQFDNTVSILLNNGNGSFAAKNDFTVGSEPISIFSADLDSDGDMDLMTTNFNSNSITILKNGNLGGELFLENNYYDFGYVNIDSAKNFTLTITNIGINHPIEIFDIISSSPAFKVSPDFGIINPGDSINTIISFIPTFGVLYDDSLKINSNDPNYPETIFYVTGYSNPISSVIPKSNSIDIPHDTNIEIVFNTDIEPSTVSDSTIMVYGHQSGLRTNNIIIYNSITKTLTIDPDQDFFYGERVDVVIPGILQYFLLEGQDFFKMI